MCQSEMPPAQKPPSLPGPLLAAQASVYHAGTTHRLLAARIAARIRRCHSPNVRAGLQAVRSSRITVQGFCMRLSIAYTPSLVARAKSAPVSDPAAPNVDFLTQDPPAALKSFFSTVERIIADNPVSLARLQELAGMARQSPLTDAESAEF